MIQTEIYSPDRQADWDAFVEKAKNATFLFKRGYMDYHRARFHDASLLFLTERCELCGILPLTLDTKRREASSHNGLTYGGLAYAPHTECARVFEMLDAMVEQLRQWGIERLIYKPLPHIYAAMPAEEDLYYLHQHGASLVERSLSSAIDQTAPLPYSTLRKRKIKKARAEGLATREVRGDEDEPTWQAYWQLLGGVLAGRHGAAPVHTIEEIRLLGNRFAGAIRLHTVSDAAGELLGGVVVYDTGRVAHCQYIAASDRGCALNALDLLFDHLIAEVYHQRHYFDFGISTERNGTWLNHGLIFQKQGFGARGICYDCYALSIPSI